MCVGINVFQSSKVLVTLLKNAPKVDIILKYTNKASPDY